MKAHIHAYTYTHTDGSTSLHSGCAWTFPCRHEKTYAHTHCWMDKSAQWLLLDFSTMNADKIMRLLVHTYTHKHIHHTYIRWVDKSAQWLRLDFSVYACKHIHTYIHTYTQMDRQVCAVASTRLLHDERRRASHDHRPLAHPLRHYGLHQPHGRHGHHAGRVVQLQVADRHHSLDSRAGDCRPVAGASPSK